MHLLLNNYNTYSIYYLHTNTLFFIKEKSIQLYLHIIVCFDKFAYTVYQHIHMYIDSIMQRQYLHYTCPSQILR